MHAANVRCKTSISVGGEVVDDIANGAEIRKCAVWDALAEMLLRETGEFDDIERIGFEVFDEARFRLHLRDRTACDFGDEMEDFGFD